VGTETVVDRPGDRFDTPSLIECWRTAPYLHDGSAATLREVLTQKNPQQHGQTSQLSSKQLEELIVYVLSQLTAGPRAVGQ
jgi:cytochrome c peroxidase